MGPRERTSKGPPFWTLWNFVNRAVCVCVCETFQKHSQILFFLGSPGPGKKATPFSIHCVCIACVTLCDSKGIWHKSNKQVETRFIAGSSGVVRCTVSVCLGTIAAWPLPALLG